MIPVYDSLTTMNHEARILYLCTQAARNQLTLDEKCELLGIMALDLDIIDYLMIEIILIHRK